MGHAAFYAIGAYATAILNTSYGVPVLWTMPFSRSGRRPVFALMVARPIIHLRGDYLLIVTIGIVEIVRIALINDVFDITGGANGIFGIRPAAVVRLQDPASRTTSSTSSGCSRDLTILLCSCGSRIRASVGRSTTCK
jgi:ABC-type branched-subunit amino acid transport system permease subunit